MAFYIDENYRKALLSKFERYHRETGRAPATLAGEIIGESGFPKRIKKGGSLSIDTFLKIERWFQRHYKNKEKLKCARNKAKCRGSKGKL